MSNVGKNKITRIRFSPTLQIFHIAKLLFFSEPFVKSLHVVLFPLFYLIDFLGNKAQQRTLMIRGIEKIMIKKTHFVGLRLGLGYQRKLLLHLFDRLLFVL